MKKRIFIVLTVVMLLSVTLLAACNGATQQSAAVQQSAATQQSAAAQQSAAVQQSAAANTDKKKIVFIQGLAGDEFYITMGKGIQAACDKAGYACEILGAAEWDYTKQAPIVEALVARASEIDMVIIAPVHADSMIAPIKKLVDAGVPVITVDTNLSDTSVALCNITSNNVQGGGVAADALAKMINNKGKVGIINTLVGVTTTEDRAKGFKDEMAAKFPDINVVFHEYFGEGSIEKAASITEVELLKFPDLNGVFGVNFEASLGIAQALDTTKKDMPVFSYDAGPPVIEALANGKIDATICQKPTEIGSKAVETATLYFNGEKDKIKDILVDNVVVTKDNMNDPEISKWFYVAN
jgi:ribose transport system substrate-binding protein